LIVSNVDPLGLFSQDDAKKHVANQAHIQ